ncbi:MAG TPA: SdrD B-like domain-containing protein [Caldilineaceae bacterium]|nr:SdrD B-like domain-containing protein [Caldilineaceae bacterium]
MSKPYTTKLAGILIGALLIFMGFRVVASPLAQRQSPAPFWPRLAQLQGQNQPSIQEVAIARTDVGHLSETQSVAAEVVTPTVSLRVIPTTTLQFRTGDNQALLQIENRAPSTTTVTLSIQQEQNAPLQGKLWLNEPVVADLTNTAQVVLGPRATQRLRFALDLRQQQSQGKAILKIANDLSTDSIQISVVAEARGSTAGLWVGEVVVNDVSEGRLGATNLTDGKLTVALRPRNNAGIVGVAELQERVTSGEASVAMSVTLMLPTQAVTHTLQPLTGTAPYIGGYLFADLNQNGQRDPVEPGFVGITVTLTGTDFVTKTVTAKHGSYLFTGLAPAAYQIGVAQPPSYTSDFTVTLPDSNPDDERPADTMANSWPMTVTVDDIGISEIAPKAYKQQTLPSLTLPQTDSVGNRVEPLVNFGLVRTYTAQLRTGSCNKPGNPVEGTRSSVVNGQLITRLENTALSPRDGAVLQLLSADHAIEVIDGDNVIACGEIAVGAPTRFADGRGSDFRFRLILRVEETGKTALLPYYAAESKDGAFTRISSPAFSITETLRADGQFAGTTPLDFDLVIDAQDPLNPFKHKYHPDHDNLNAQFNPIDLDSVPPYLWESYDVHRQIQLELSELPPLDGATPADAAQLDWGGATWGGYCRKRK